MKRKNKKKKIKKNVRNCLVDKYQKYNIMVIIQKRASGLQVRGNSFVNLNHYTPFRVYFRSGGFWQAKPRDCVRDLFPMLGLKIS
jgi:hypothetical protein